MPSGFTGSALSPALDGATIDVGYISVIHPQYAFDTIHRSIHIDKSRKRLLASLANGKISADALTLERHPDFFRKTLDVYQTAVRYLLHVHGECHDCIDQMSSKLDRMMSERAELFEEVVQLRENNAIMKHRLSRSARQLAQPAGAAGARTPMLRGDSADPSKGRYSADGRGAFRCSMCGNAYPSEYALHSHVEKRHLSSSSSASSIRRHQQQHEVVITSPPSAAFSSHAAPTMHDMEAQAMRSEVTMLRQSLADLTLSVRVEQQVAQQQQRASSQSPSFSVASAETMVIVKSQQTRIETLEKALVQATTALDMQRQSYTADAIAQLAQLSPPSLSRLSTQRQTAAVAQSPSIRRFAGATAASEDRQYRYAHVRDSTSDVPRTEMEEEEEEQEQDAVAAPPSAPSAFVTKHDQPRTPPPSQQKKSSSRPQQQGTMQSEERQEEEKEDVEGGLQPSLLRNRYVTPPKKTTAAAASVKKAPPSPRSPDRIRKEQAEKKEEEPSKLKDANELLQQSQQHRSLGSVSATTIASTTSAAAATNKDKYKEKDKTKERQQQQQSAVLMDPGVSNIHGEEDEEDDELRAVSAAAAAATDAAKEDSSKQQRTPRDQQSTTFAGISDITTGSTMSGGSSSKKQQQVVSESSAGKRGGDPSATTHTQLDSLSPIDKTTLDAAASPPKKSEGSDKQLGDAATPRRQLMPLARQEGEEGDEAEALLTGRTEGDDAGKDFDAATPIPTEEKKKESPQQQQQQQKDTTKQGVDEERHHHHHHHHRGEQEEQHRGASVSSSDSSGSSTSSASSSSSSSSSGGEQEDDDGDHKKKQKPHQHHHHSEEPKKAEDNEKEEEGEGDVSGEFKLKQKSGGQHRKPSMQQQAKPAEDDFFIPIDQSQEAEQQTLPPEMARSGSSKKGNLKFLFQSNLD